jgi:hypothetical protein
MEENKDLKEFLEVLIDMNQSNIDFIKNPNLTIYPPKLFQKYVEEIKQIQDLINTFDFVKEKK